MDERNPPNRPIPSEEGDRLSGGEIQIEREKLRLEHERILLERDRLDAVRERLESENRHLQGINRKLKVPVSTLAMSSIICLLVGGILGAFSMSVRQDRQNRARLQKVMDTFALGTETLSGERPSASTNSPSRATGNALPSWLKTVKPKGEHTGVSLVFIQ